MHEDTQEDKRVCLCSVHLSRLVSVMMASPGQHTCPASVFLTVETETHTWVHVCGHRAKK